MTARRAMLGETAAVTPRLQMPAVNTVGFECVPWTAAEVLPVAGSPASHWENGRGSPKKPALRSSSGRSSHKYPPVHPPKSSSAKLSAIWSWKASTILLYSNACFSWFGLPYRGRKASNAHSIPNISWSVVSTHLTKLSQWWFNHPK